MERAEPERAAFVVAACSGDEDLFAEVERLLEAHGRAGTFLEHPAWAPTKAIDGGAATETAAPRANDGPPTIGRYRTQRLIGAGGMGAVYEAVQDHPRRVVALKIMRRGLGSASAVRRFEMEAELLGRMHHPGIAQVYEAGAYDDGAGPAPFFALEYIPGALPITRFAEERRLSVDQKIQLFEQVCDAVHHAHSRGIIHRDLKPSNILVESSGRPKIIDFGVGRGSDAGLSEHGLRTDPGQLIGTLQYMSPEQAGATDAGDVDFRADVYSLGVVLYELLCGRPPYDLSNTSTAEAARRVRETLPEAPGSISRELRGDLSTILLVALHKDRRRRYQSAAELGEDLRRYAAGEPIRARQDSIAYLVATRATSRIRAHPAISLLACLAVSAAIARIGVEYLIRYATPVDRWVQTALGYLPSAPAGGLLAPVRIVAITDSTPVESLAAAAGVEGVRVNEPKSLRSLHGAMMKRLAGAGVRAVLWDLDFLGDTPHDLGFAAGARELRRLGVPVLANRESWRGSAENDPATGPIIQSSVVLCGATGDLLATHLMQLDLLVQHAPNNTVASPALATFAALSRPGATPFFMLRPHDSEVEVFYSSPPGEQGRAATPQPGRDVIRATEISEESAASKDSSLGIEAGDVVASLFIPIPSSAGLAAVTVPYERIFDGQADEIAAALSGKVIIVSDQRTGSGDFLDPPANQIPGCAAHAAAVGALLLGIAPLSPDRAGWWWIVLGAATGGTAIPSIVGRSTARQAAAAAAGCAALIVASALLYHRLMYVCDPIMPIAALVLATTLAAGVGRLRARRGGVKLRGPTG